jgi:hypothetical protein
MNLSSIIKQKQFYRITGTPENFLTAIKHMTWGFLKDNKDDWDKINPGDIIFFHTKKNDSYFLKNGKSCIVGLGIASNIKFYKENKLWVEEFDKGISIYPYKFKFSEIYTFNKLPDSSKWDSQRPNNNSNILEAINSLLKNAIPLNVFDGFPRMGSYSTIKNEKLKNNLISELNNLFISNLNEIIPEDNDLGLKLEEMNKIEDSLRFATSLTIFDDIKKKFNRKTKQKIFYTKDSLALEKANKEHQDTLNKILKLFHLKGYSTYNNRHIDLFAHNNKKSFLVEVKSINKNNQIEQFRKGFVQLFEYEFFEIRKFKKDYNLSFQESNNCIITSKSFSDKNYLMFAEKYNIAFASYNNNKLCTQNRVYNFNQLIKN